MKQNPHLIHLRYWLWLVAIIGPALPATAQETDELQALIDRISTAPVTRADGPNIIDLSSYGTRTSTLYVRNGVNVRFVNGTLTRAESLAAPLVIVNGGSTLELAETAKLSGGERLSEYPVVQVDDGTLNVTGGIISGNGLYVKPVYLYSRASKMPPPTLDVDFNFVGYQSPHYTSFTGPSVSLTQEHSVLSVSAGLVDRVIFENGNMSVWGGTVKEVVASKPFKLGGGEIQFVDFMNNSANVILCNSLTQQIKFYGLLEGQKIITSQTDQQPYYYVSSDDLLKVGIADQSISAFLDSSSGPSYIYVKLKSEKTLTLTDVEPGTLPERITNPDNVEELTITGRLNGTDFYLIRQMGKKNLKKLDISGVTIVSGGNAYYCDDENSSARSTANKTGMPAETVDRVESSDLTRKKAGANDCLYTANNIIGGMLFSDCTTLEYIALPNSATTILNIPFWSCTNLKTIIFGRSITKIEGTINPFVGCYSLTTVEMQGNTNFTMDGGILFDSGKKIAYGSLPAVVGETVSLPQTVTTISWEAFVDCKMKSIYIPAGVTKISPYAFSYCKALEDVYFSGNITEIGTYAFYTCGKLKNIYFGHDNLVFPSSLQAIGKHAFYNCGALPSLNLASTIITEIQYATFWNCTSLKTLYLPATLKTINEFAFGQAPLNSIYSYASTPPAMTDFNSNDGESFWSSIRNSCTVHVPLGSLKGYKAAVGWKQFANMVQDLPGTDPDYISNEDDLQRRLDEIAEEKPSKAVTLTIAEEGITLTKGITVKADCKVVITGGTIKLSSEMKLKNSYPNCVFNVYNGELTLQDINIDCNNVEIPLAFFNSSGDLTIGQNVSYLNVYQGEGYLYGFYMQGMDEGYMTILSGDLELHGNIFYITHGGRAYIGGGNFTTTGDYAVITGDGDVTIGDAHIGGPINLRGTLYIGHFEIDFHPSITSRIIASNTVVYRRFALSEIYIRKQAVLTLNWRYRIYYKEDEYQGKWTLDGDWAEMELGKAFVVSGEKEFPMMQEDFDNMVFINMPDDREPYFDETDHTVKLRAKRDPNIITDEDDLQRRLDEIAAEKPENPVPLTIAEEGITLTSAIHVKKECLATITGGTIHTANSFSDDALFNVQGWIEFNNIAFDFHDKPLRVSYFVAYDWGYLTMGEGVEFLHVNQDAAHPIEAFYKIDGHVNIYSGDVSVYGTIVSNNGETSITGGELRSRGNYPAIEGTGYLVMSDGTVSGEGEQVIAKSQAFYFYGGLIESDGTGALVSAETDVHYQGGNLRGKYTYCNGEISSYSYYSNVFSTFDVEKILVTKTAKIDGRASLPLLHIGKEGVIQLTETLRVNWQITADWKEMMSWLYETSPQEPYRVLIMGNKNAPLNAGSMNRITFLDANGTIDFWYDAENDNIMVGDELQWNINQQLSNLEPGDTAEIPVDEDGLDTYRDTEFDELQWEVDGGDKPNEDGHWPEWRMPGGCVFVNLPAELTVKNLEFTSYNTGHRIYVDGTFNIAKNVTIREYIAFSIVRNNGHLIWQDGHTEDVRIPIYIEGGTADVLGGTLGGQIINLAGGLLNIAAGVKADTIRNEGTANINGSAELKLLQLKQGVAVSLTSALSKPWNISIYGEEGEELHLVDGTPVLLSSETYTVTEADLHYLVAELPKGFHLEYDATAKAIVICADKPDNIQAVGKDESATAVYNLQGQRVMKPIPGKIYIKAGKKFVAR